MQTWYQINAAIGLVGVLIFLVWVVYTGYVQRDKRVITLTRWMFYFISLALMVELIKNMYGN